MMTDAVREIAGQRCLVVGADGPTISDADGARELIGEAMSERARVVAVPAGRLDPSFFRLRSGLAGEILQKMVNYHLKFAIVGDTSAYVGASDALRDFVIECERGESVYFVEDMSALAARLGRG